MDRKERVIEEYEVAGLVEAREDVAGHLKGQFNGKNPSPESADDPNRTPPEPVAM